jgi:hypothetical protein
MKINWSTIIVNFYIGVVGILYVVLKVLREYYTLELINEELYAYVLGAFSCGIIINRLIRPTIRKVDVGIMVIFFITILGCLKIASINTTQYINIESPLGKHKIIAENTVVGFETGATYFYRIKMSVFKENIAGIMLEKTGGVLETGKNVNFKWLNEDILKIEYQYSYNRELHIYEIDFNTDKISEEIEFY